MVTEQQDLHQAPTAPAIAEVANLDELENGLFDIHWSKEKEGAKLDLACGTNIRKGYAGVDSMSKEQLAERTAKFDVAPETYDDYVQHDLFDFPWPFEDNSVAATFSSHFVEHIPHQIPGTDLSIDGWWLFFEELYRVLEDGGIAEFIHPFSRSDRAFWDPTHTRFIHYQTWFYLSKEFRLQVGMDHYVPDIDFEVLSIQTTHEPALLEGRSSEVIEFARQFYWNVTDDLFVVVRATK